MCICFAVEVLAKVKESFSNGATARAGLASFISAYLAPAKRTRTAVPASLTGCYLPRSHCPQACAAWSLFVDACSRLKDSSWTCFRSLVADVVALSLHDNGLGVTNRVLDMLPACGETCKVVEWSVTVEPCKAGTT